MSSGYVTYYWQASSQDVLQALLFSTSQDEQGNPIQVNVLDNLSIAEGNGTYGDSGTYYTCARTVSIIETPDGCQIADPYIVSNLLGVWA